MANEFNPFDLGAWLVPDPDVARRESIQLQKWQTQYLREIARSQRDATVSPVTYEFAQSVTSLTDGLASLGYNADRAAEVVANLRIDVQKGFQGLGALFDWRMASVISLLEQQQTASYEIRDLLRYPRKTSANEDKADARQALRVAFNSDNAARKQWLERALNYFRAAAEKNPFDYTVHLDMGTLLLEAYEQPEQALPCFQEAARTAQTAGDREYESKAHFFAGRAHGQLGQHEEAYKATRRALDLQPDSQVVIYECARCCALTGRADECAQHVERLLRTDAIGGKVTRAQAEAWWGRVQSDTELAKQKLQLERVRANLADAARTAAMNAIASLERSIQFLAGIGHEVQASSKQVEDLLTVGDYFDALLAVELAHNTKANVVHEGQQLLSNDIAARHSEIEKVDCAMREAEREAKKDIAGIMAKKSNLDEFGRLQFDEKSSPFPFAGACGLFVFFLLALWALSSAGLIFLVDGMALLVVGIGSLVAIKGGFFLGLFLEDNLITKKRSAREGLLQVELQSLQSTKAALAEEIRALEGDQISLRWR